MHHFQQLLMAIRLTVFFVFLINTSLLFAQKDTTIPLRFIPTYTNSEQIHLQDSAFNSNDKDSIQITTLKFYISGIELYKEGSLVWKEKNSYHLIDASEENSLSMPLSVPAAISYDRFSFNLGIDSTTNMMGVQGGDLDPMRGMYWTWQSGYINFKLEGSSPLCNTRHHAFEFHIGGYHYPYNTLQRISLTIDKKNKEIAVIVNLKELLASLNLAKTNQIMTPGKEAVWIAEKANDCFRIITLDKVKAMQ